MDSSVFETIPQEPQNCGIVGFASPTPLWEIIPLGHWQGLPAGYILAKKKKAFRSGRPII